MAHPADRMKMREQPVVPLAWQAVEIFQGLEPLTNRAFRSRPDAPDYVFSSRNAPTADERERGSRRVRRMGYTKKR